MRRTLCSWAGLALLVVGGFSGCGGDDEPKSGAGETGAKTVERVYRAPTAGQTTPEDMTAEPPPGQTAEEPSPDTEPQAPGEGDGGGGPDEPAPDEGGDEEPARTEIVLNASRSGIKPRRVGVAPYISVKITLVTRDGTSHTLVLGGKRLKVSGRQRSAFVVLPGLRPQKGVTGVFDGRTRVRIFGSAEPGP